MFHVRKNLFTSFAPHVLSWFKDVCDLHIFPPHSSILDLFPPADVSDSSVWNYSPAVHSNRLSLLIESIFFIEYLFIKSWVYFWRLFSGRSCQKYMIIVVNWQLKVNLSSWMVGSTLSWVFVGASLDRVGFLPHEYLGKALLATAVIYWNTWNFLNLPTMMISSNVVLLFFRGSRHCSTDAPYRFHSPDRPAFDRHCLEVFTFPTC